MKRIATTLAIAAFLYATPALAANSFWGGFAEGLQRQQYQKARQTDYLLWQMQQMQEEQERQELLEQQRQLQEQMRQLQESLDNR